MVNIIKKMEVYIKVILRKANMMVQEKNFLKKEQNQKDYLKIDKKNYVIYELNNGSKYQGSFLNGLFHGKGIYIWPIQKTYDGYWINGKMNGEGKFTYPNGSYYEGKFIKGKKCGLGKYKWDNDKYYEGNWKNDKQNGYYMFYDKNKVTKSIWVDGKIRNRNGEIIKKNKTYMEDNKNTDDYFDKKGITIYNRIKTHTEKIQILQI